jgi:hypothetical protein
MKAPLLRVAFIYTPYRGLSTTFDPKEWSIHCLEPVLVWNTTSWSHYAEYRSDVCFYGKSKEEVLNTLRSFVRKQLEICEENGLRVDDESIEL